jgi:hypothetical protein
MWLTIGPLPVQVDSEMRFLLQNLRDMLEAEKAARAGKKKGKWRGAGWAVTEHA